MSNNNSFEGRIFKLSTGEKISHADFEELIGEVCHYIKYVAVSEDENEDTIALLFPNKKLFDHPDYKLTPDEGCFCPRSLDELGRCLSGCMKLVNRKMLEGESQLKSAAIINPKVSNEGNLENSLTIIDKYKNILRGKYGNHVPSNEEIYFIKNI